MIIHHHNKFGKKWFSSAGDTEWTQLDRTTDGQGDSNTPHPHICRGGGGGDKKQGEQGRDHLPVLKSKGLGKGSLSHRQCEV